MGVSVLFLDLNWHYTIQVAHLYHRKQATYSENKVFPHIGLNDLRKDLIDLCRKLATIGTAGHPWSKMSDMELIQSAQLYQIDPDTKKAVLQWLAFCCLAQIS